MVTAAIHVPGRQNRRIDKTLGEEGMLAEFFTDKHRIRLKKEGDPLILTKGKADIFYLVLIPARDAA